MQALTEPLHWLLIFVLAVAMGAGIYEHRIVISSWRGTRPQTWPNVGLRFWVFVSTGPLTLLGIGNAFTTAGLDSTDARTAWWTVLAVLLVERTLTLAYFIPTMVDLGRDSSLSQDDVDTTLDQWLRINLLRHMLAIAAFLLALRAFTIGE